MKKLKVVVSGYIGLLPAGGVTWDYVQYPLGFRELGCDVLYLEDTQQWPVYQATENEISCRSNVNYLASVMHHFDLRNRWCYRDEVTGQYFGMSREEVRRFCASADVLINVSCSTPLRDEYTSIPIRALVDTDPMFTQVQYVTDRGLFGGVSAIPEMVSGHTHLFTFGENINGSDCEVPCAELCWRPTRQPVVLRYWPETELPNSGHYTSVFNWTATKEFQFMGKCWGQKNAEFMRFFEIPRRVPAASFSIGVGQTTGDPFPEDAAERIGWHVLKADTVARDVDSYQQFIWSSRGEFSVAKQTYVQAKTGWFSCRSACYLASGRPVVTQDTGWSDFIPNGCGLMPFTDEDSAIDAVERIEHEPKKNARAARCIAAEAFDSGKVLQKMLTELGY